MTANAAEIVPQVAHEVQPRLADVPGPEAQGQTAQTVERTVCRRLLAWGAARWRRLFVTRAAVRPAEPVRAPEGTRWRSHAQRPTMYDAGLGNVLVVRHACTAPGHPGDCPLAAELRVPARGSSDLLCAWGAQGTPDASSRESRTVLVRILGVSLRGPALEASVAEAAGEVTAGYAQPAAPSPPAPDATILVVQADGPGVPMGQPSPPTPRGRLGKGETRGQTKDAVVTGLQTIAPYRRPPQEVVAALLPAAGRPQPSARPRPVAKARHATRAGKAVAMTRVVPRVIPREGPHLQPRVARTAGAESLPHPLVSHLPASTRGLDSRHATAQLWDTATVLRGATQPHRTAWVRSALEPGLAGQREAVSTALAAEAHEPVGTATQRHAVQRTLGSDRRHRPYMRDDEDLAQGWPSGTGVIEGAWGPLGNDRLEPSGMRRTPAGAQAVLDLRAVRLNGHGDRAGPLHRQQPHQHLYHRATPVPEQAESHLLEWAA